MSAIFAPNKGGQLLPVPTGASTYHQDSLVYIDRQAKQIERKLQDLIDAQSEGLQAGLAGPQSNATPSTSGSHTPTSALGSVKGGPSTVPVRQPLPEKIGLRAAREGIFNSIYDLLKLREEEHELLIAQVDERHNALQDIDGFNTKRAGLEDAISTIQENKEGQRTRELREESYRLEEDIHEMETRLSQMKARQQHVIRELSHMENSVESTLSSYKASLSLLESSVRKYLQDPPVRPLPTKSGDATFFSLNPKRRTLALAQEHWTKEQADLRHREGEVKAEIEALEAGGGVWKQVVGEVTGYEKRLKSKMRRYMQKQSQRQSPTDPLQNTPEDDIARDVLEDLGHTSERVEYKLELAESKNWKLLVCCISAELQALHEARLLLMDLFNVSDADVPRRTVDGRARNGHSAIDDEHDVHADPLAVDNPEPPADLLRDTEEHSHGAVSRSEDEDDEPDPAWLLPES
ncbi:uncharacterized protein BO97DRAFT_403164 [Aspergillus homomorphus CBS 101889]|uniref:Autophagy-related protein Atg28 n=1 Tax=Aspergillus homomorphus (strain CBS 101889) TaxID=1450537 RepID=A0A395I799_ASPHC|nr:hypothetical protein BO97DRAFT_403164 [Aspergillus homomorphus CBS 101889]RAL15977.1 hypothetical protein BO97DRAFT_403164 [Aspergillus homomorphus CBS 101889]